MINLRDPMARLSICLPGIAIVLLWELTTAGSTRRQFLFGSPSLVIKAATADFLAGDIILDLGTTALEAVLGLIVGSALGTAIGLLMWISPRIGRLSRPYITIIGAVPPFALAPMLIIWFGTGLLPKIVMAAFSVCLVSIVQAYEGAHNANVAHLQLAKGLGATRYQILTKIIFPNALVWVLAGFKLNIGFAMIGAFIGEFMVSERGIGHYILRAGGLYDTPRVVLGIILMAGVGLVLTAILVWFERMWFPWLPRGGDHTDRL